MQSRKPRYEMVLFFVMISFAALANGLSDSVYANYFKDAYNVTTTQRAFIEFPRELPGLLCALVISGLSFLGDVRTSFIAQLLAFFGLAVLGLFTPVFSVMLIFLFINSLGMHMFMPLQDSIGMALAEPGQVGRRVGQYASVKMIFGFAAGITVFFGFRFNVFSFHTPVNLLFLIAAGAFLVAAVAAFLLSRFRALPTAPPVRRKLIFRKEYRWYYMLTLLHGVQKQIAFVFGGWVIISLLGKGAATMSMLMILASFVSIFFTRYLGRWIDRLGIRRMLYIDSISLIAVYLLYGFVVWGIAKNAIPLYGWPALIIYGLFILDRLSMQMGVIRSVYLKSIAVAPEEITNALSTGISLDHAVSIVAAQFSALIWTAWGPQWVFFLAAFFSLGNLFISWRVRIAAPEESAA
ncbi:MAG: MFS transporter [Eubacteriales bacterium]|jgi:hypothetical protein|nr:MFS transporter [Eubacteriales bacterium]MDD4104556.1 MFS transporter [Eubacteriales bacterium]MDD4710139.1 MFS transporter [Eubacteriales bacterium]NLO14632.1 MFS transporter [Clostridiales bacterium]